MADMDDRGFQKAELVMFNPAAPNIQSGVNLVSRDTCPNGYQLVDPDRSGKKTQFDLVELAAQVEKADQFTRATAGSKLQIIAEQVRYQTIYIRASMFMIIVSGQISARAGQEGAGGRQTERSAAQDQLQLQEDPRQDVLRVQAEEEP